MSLPILIILSPPGWPRTTGGSRSSPQTNQHVDVKNHYRCEREDEGGHHKHCLKDTKIQLFKYYGYQVVCFISDEKCGKPF